MSDMPNMRLEPDRRTRSQSSRVSAGQPLRLGVLGLHG